MSQIMMQMSRQCHLTNHGSMQQFSKLSLMKFSKQTWHIVHWFQQL